MKNKSGNSTILVVGVVLVAAFTFAAWYMGDNSNNKAMYSINGKSLYSGIQNSKAGQTFNTSAGLKVSGEKSTTSNLPTYKKKSTTSAGSGSVDFPSTSNPSAANVNIANNSIQENSVRTSTVQYSPSNNTNNTTDFNALTIVNQPTPQQTVTRQIVNKTDMDPAFLLYKIKPTGKFTAAQSKASKAGDAVATSSKASKTGRQKTDGGSNPGDPGYLGGSLPVGNGVWILLSLLAVYSVKKQYFS